MKLSNQAYDTLKWIVQIFLPAFGALYFGLSALWGFPKAEEVVGTVTVIAAFLGALIQLSKVKYDKNTQGDSE